MTTEQERVPHLDEIVAAATAEIAAAALLQAQHLTPLTDDDPEPRHGSIVMLTSTTGTAAQRHYSDGLWYTTTGEIATYAGLFLRRDGRARDVFLVWEAPVWEGHRPRYVEGD